MTLPSPDTINYLRFRKIVNETDPETRRSLLMAMRRMVEEEDIKQMEADPEFQKQMGGANQPRNRQ